MMNNSSLLSQTLKFWNSNPCDGNSEDLNTRQLFRYNKEPWLLPLLDTLADSKNRILEIGCGQGTDAFYICMKKKQGEYIAIDYSDESINFAKKNLKCIVEQFKVIPQFMTGNAEELPFEDDFFDIIYSMGVLHHTPSIQKSIREAKRVLKKDGKAYIILYRKHSPKLILANSFRSLQKVVGFILKKENPIYNMVKRMDSDRFGTIFKECFGVPILNSYTKREIQYIFNDFKIEKIKSVGGVGIPYIPRFLNQIIVNNKFWGTYWEIIIKNNDYSN